MLRKTGVLPADHGDVFRNAFAQTRKSPVRLHSVTFPGYENRGDLVFQHRFHPACNSGFVMKLQRFHMEFHFRAETPVGKKRLQTVIPGKTGRTEKPDAAVPAVNQIIQRAPDSLFVVGMNRADVFKRVGKIVQADERHVFQLRKKTPDLMHEIKRKRAADHAVLQQGKIVPRDNQQLMSAPFRLSAQRVEQRKHIKTERESGVRH